MKEKIIADQKIKDLTSHVILFKGRPWSETEFKAMVAAVHDQLMEDGATKEQLQKFNQLIKTAPIIGGSFNTWSGD